MIALSCTEYTECPFFRVPEQERFITKEACIRRNIPVTAAVSRDTKKGKSYYITNYVAVNYTQRSYHFSNNIPGEA